MIDIAHQLMRSRRVAFFYDQTFVKDPQTIDRTEWHHDMPYWPISGHQIVSIWLALTPVSSLPPSPPQSSVAICDCAQIDGVAASALEYVAGSHRWGTLYRARTPDEDERYEDTALPLCPDFFRAENRRHRRFLSWSMEVRNVWLIIMDDHR